MKSRIYRLYQYLFAVWIAYFEGYFTPDSVAHRNRNPGNLRGWSNKTHKDERGFDIFPSPTEGWNALLKQVELNFDRGLTVREFFKGKPGIYAGYDAPGPDAYPEFIARKTGIPVDNYRIIDVIGHIERDNPVS